MQISGSRGVSRGATVVRGPLYNLRVMLKLLDVGTVPGCPMQIRSDQISESRWPTTTPNPPTARVQRVGMQCCRLVALHTDLTFANPGVMHAGMSLQ